MGVDGICGAEAAGVPACVAESAGAAETAGAAAESAGAAAGGVPWASADEDPGEAILAEGFGELAAHAPDTKAAVTPRTC